MRVAALNRIGEQELTNLWKLRSARGWRKAEPMDHHSTPEQPRLLKRSVGLIVESGILARESMPDRFGLSAFDIENLAGLPMGYFKPVESRVVDINAIRLRRATEP
jgi:hypothetical protein